jgi:hypothetical protein
MGVDERAHLFRQRLPVEQAEVKLHYSAPSRRDSCRSTTLPNCWPTPTSCSRSAPRTERPRSPSQSARTPRAGQSRHGRDLGGEDRRITFSMRRSQLELAPPQPPRALSRRADCSATPANSTKRPSHHGLERSHGLRVSPRLSRVTGRKHRLTARSSGRCSHAAPAGNPPAGRPASTPR